MSQPTLDAYEPVVGREFFIMGVLGLAALLFGILPALVFDMTNETFRGIMAVLGMG